MINSLLVANRGEIACRIFRTCDELGIRKLAVYSDADSAARHVRMADQAIRIGGPAPADSYLRSDLILAAAREMGASAIHPGYGFLSENVEFAREVTRRGLVWVGPSPDSMEIMAEKVPARRVMRDAGVPIVPGTEDEVLTVESALAEATRIGYPVMLEASAGGGGIGMTVVESPSELAEAFAGAQDKAERFFANGAVYLEKYIRSARHIEVQVLGLGSGRIVIVGDRDCSVQRRHQKVLEEAPCTTITEQERAYLHNVARRAAEQIDYRGAGTVEMIFDRQDRKFYFLEMNTRLQVEHPVTELVTGVDLVRLQLQIAAGEDLDAELPETVPSSGHAVEFRVYAEDPVRFIPGPGTITAWTEPSGDDIRVDSGYGQGDAVTPFYDPLLAKLCTFGPDRATALNKLAQAATEFEIVGPKNNLALAKRLCEDSGFLSDRFDTSILAR